MVDLRVRRLGDDDREEAHGHVAQRGPDGERGDHVRDGRRRDHPVDDVAAEAVDAVALGEGDAEEERADVDEEESAEWQERIEREVRQHRAHDEDVDGAVHLRTEATEREQRERASRAHRRAQEPDRDVEPEGREQQGDPDRGASTDEHGDHARCAGESPEHEREWRRE